MTALVGVWFCWCSDAAETRAGIPDLCPHHGARLIAVPEVVDRDGPVRLGHACPTTDDRTDHRGMG